MESVKLCAAAFLCTVTVVLVRQYRSEFTLSIRTAAVILLLGFGLVLLSPTVRWIETLSQQVFSADHATLLLRALCILFLVRICAALCRDCGEPTIALCLEFAGKAELILLMIPLLEQLLTGVSAFLSWQ